MTDHVHMLVSIPPKYSVAEVIGFIKGKGEELHGHKFWARGYFEGSAPDL